MLYLYILVVLIGVVVLVVKRRRALGFIKTLIDRLKLTDSSDSPAGGTNSPIEETLDDRSISNDSAVKEELQKLNQGLADLSRLISASHLESIEQQSSFHSNLLTYQSVLRERLRNVDDLAGTLQRLLNIESRTEREHKSANLDAIAAEWPARAADLMRDTSVLSEERTPDPPAFKESSKEAVGAPQAEASVTHLEDFVAQNINQINRAGFNGVKGVRYLVEHTDDLIEVRSPADGIFILTERDSGERSSGKAFVLPGELLGRPWVEWFEVTKELVCPIESTVFPATVVRRADDTWQLLEKGRVSQQ